MNPKREILLPLGGAFVGLLVLWAWSQGRYEIVSWGEGEVTVKKPTAYSILSLSIASLLPARSGGSRLAIRALALLPMSLMLGVLIRFHLGFAEALGMMGEPSHLAVDSVSPGIPSWGTALAVILIAFSLILRSHGSRGVSLAMTALLIVSIAGVGHLFDFPFLYYSFPAKSTAMARLTVIGLALVSLNEVTRRE